MSKAKDRARAKSGTIFRDGSYVNKEEWYAAHPTREMRQARVDVAVTEAMAMKPTHKEREAAGEPPFDYFCTKCERTHKHGSKIHKNHVVWAKVEITPQSEREA